MDLTAFRQLQESEDQLRFAIEAAELGTWDYNPRTGRFTANERLKEWFGLDPKNEIELSMALRSMIEPDRERVAAAISLALDPASGGYYDIKYSLLPLGDKSPRIVRAKGRAWFDTSGTAYRFNGTLQDITDQEIARTALQESADFAHNIFHNSVAGQIVYTGEDMVIAMANQQVLDMLGRDSSAIGRPFMDVSPELSGTTLMDRLRHVLRTGETYHQPEERFDLIKYGRPHIGYFNFTYQALTNSNGEHYGVLGTATEITEAVLTRIRIEQAEQKALLAIASADLGTYEINLLTDEMTTSERFNTIWGTNASFHRSEFASSIHPDDRAMREQAHRDSIPKGSLHYEARIIWDDGSIHWIRVNGKVLYNTDGEAATLIGVIQDITEQKQFARQLTLQVKERTLELQRSNNDLLQFAHVISHDLKEPVRKVKVFSNRLQEEEADGLNEKARSYLGKVQHATDRMMAMIEGVLTYSTLSSAEQTIGPVALQETIQQIQSDLEVLIQQKKAIFHVGELPVIEGAPVLLYQLFYNLVNNAIKFSRPDTPPIIKISSSGLDSHASIVIADNGIGFDQDDADKIFDPFQRLHAKDKYEGTGLGLALCKKIVDRHAGSITAHSSQDRGAIFTVTLPLKHNGTNL